MALRFETPGALTTQTTHGEQPARVEYTLSKPSVYGNILDMTSHLELPPPNGEFHRLNAEDLSFDDTMLLDSGYDEQEMLMAEPELLDPPFINDCPTLELSQVIELADAIIRLFICEQPSGISAAIKVLNDRRQGLLSTLVPALFRLNHIEVTMVCFLRLM